jgi:hypothetical protein
VLTIDWRTAPDAWEAATPRPFPREESRRFGDSSGPIFVGGSNEIIAVNSFVKNYSCGGQGFAYRVDTQEVQDWMESVLAPPLGSGTQSPPPRYGHTLRPALSPGGGIVDFRAALHVMRKENDAGGRSARARRRDEQCVPRSAGRRQPGRGAHVARRAA